MGGMYWEEYKLCIKEISYCFIFAQKIDIHKCSQKHNVNLFARKHPIEPHEASPYLCCLYGHAHFKVGPNVHV